MPHQQYVMDVGLEHDADGATVYDEVVLTIMRQSGKTTGTFCKKCWRLTMAPRLLRPDGLPWGPQRGMYTAQTRQAARKKLERDFADSMRTKLAKASFSEIRNAKARPHGPAEWKLSLNNGSEHILFGHGNYLQIDAPSRTAGHGDTLDDGDIDEAFALRSDDVEQAMVPAMATRWNAQLGVASTAGDENSPYLWGKVLAGRKAIEDGIRSRVAYFEWSIPDDADIDDEDVWWEFMPALGRTITPERVRSMLERARRNPVEGEDLWRRSMGNMWVRIPVLTGEMRPAKLPADRWAATGIGEAEVRQRFPKATTMAFDVTKDGGWASISVGSGSLEEPCVQTVVHRRGVDWLPDVLVEWVRLIDPTAVGCNGAGPAGAQVGRVMAAFKTAGISVELLEQMSAVEYKQACGAFYSHVVEGRLSRPAEGQQPLDLAAGDATERPLGDAWAWDLRNATVPISPLTSATIAVALLPVASRKAQPPMFAYT